MKTWLVRLAGAVDILLGLIIILLNVGMSLWLTSERGTASIGSAEMVWTGIGGILTVAGVGALLHRAWARVLGTLLALIYLIICSAFFALHGINFEEGNEKFKTWGVISTGLVQLIVLLILLVAWPRRAATN